MRNQRLIGYAKEMRTTMTPAEAALWRHLRADRFQGAKFRRQVVIGSYIADFACRYPRMLIVEVDGDTHGDRADYDARRTRELEARGYRVVRFTNDDVRTNFEGVLGAIAKALALPLSPALSPKGERGKEEGT